MERQNEYATKLYSAIMDVLQNEDNDNYIDMEDISEGENATHFMYALSVMMPAVVYNKLTNNETNFLEFNHIQNTLCFQYSEKSDFKSK